MRTVGSPLIKRSPVYDGAGQVFGFELAAIPQSHGGSPPVGEGEQDDRFSARAIVHGVLSGVLDGLAGGGRLVVEVSAELLVSQLAPLLPASSTAVKLPPGTPVERELAAVLDDLRRCGALVILSRYVPGDARQGLLRHADIVALDLSGGATAVPPRGQLPKLPLLAERIGDLDALNAARDLGCSLFSGAAFVGSAVVDRPGPVGFKPIHLAVLKAVSRPELDFAELERLVKQDVQLTHAFLRYVNSAYYGWRNRLESLLHAFVLLGEQAVRSWATLVVMADLAADQPQQMAVTAAMRARFCELLGADAGVEAQPLDLFALGMFSLIDVLSGRPLRSVLAELPLSPPVQSALLGGDNALRSLLDAVVAYEHGDWSGLSEALEALGAGDEHLLEHYLAAVDWAAGTFDRAVAGEAEHERPAVCL